MKKILKFLIVFAVFLFLPVSAKADEKVINIHLFYGNGCPHCAAEEEFLSDYLKIEQMLNYINMKFGMIHIIKNYYQKFKKKWEQQIKMVYHLL